MVLMIFYVLSHLNSTAAPRGDVLFVPHLPDEEPKSQVKIYIYICPVAKLV